MHTKPADRNTAFRLQLIEQMRTTPAIPTLRRESQFQLTPQTCETKPEVFDPYASDMNVEVGPVSGHEYRSMKDGPLVNVAKWFARVLLAVGMAGLVLAVFGMMQK